MRSLQNLLIVPAVILAFLGSLGWRGIMQALRGCYLEYRSPAN